MHGLPDWPAFGVECGDGIQDFLGGVFSAFVLPEIILLAADHWRHSVCVDDAAAEPVVWLADFRVEGIHRYREIGQAFFVAFIYGFFLGGMFVQVRYLAADDAGDYV